MKKVESGSPGDRLPGMRELVKEFRASQGTIERCMDELDRIGLIRREWGRGTFIAGSEPQGSVLGVYTDGAVSAHSNHLFLTAVREAAGREGYQVADFGLRNVYENPGEILATMEKMGFAGVIAAISTLNFLQFERESILEVFQRLRLPIVTCLPIPAIAADSIMPDNFATFRALGAYLRPRLTGPVKFLGHLGLPSLARLHGLKVGLGDAIHVGTEMFDHAEGLSAFLRAKELIAEKYEGNLIIGVPPDSPGTVAELAGAPWTEGSPFHLAVTLEDGDQLPRGVNAHIILRPSYKMGAAATEMLLRRIRGFRGEMTRKFVHHEIHHAKESSAVR